MRRLTFIFALIAVFFISACGESAPDSVSNHEQASIAVKEKQETESAAKSDDKDEEEISTKEEIEEEPSSPANLRELKIHFIDVGQADATLFQYSEAEEDYTILYDTGDWRGDEVVPYLNSQGVSTLDLVIVSHPDADHIGQLDKVMQSFEVGEVWMSGNESSSQTFQRAIEAVLESDADYHEPRAGETFTIGPMDIEVIYPESISGKSNEESIAARFTYGGLQFLLTGDADRSGESYMRNNFTVDADVLHLGHHGSKTSNDPAFIDAVSPDIAIYSAGANNSYGHPSPEVIEAVEERNIDIYGTDTHGTIILTSDGEEISVEFSGPDSSMKAPQNEEDTTSKEQEVSENDNNQSASCVDINEAYYEEVQKIIHIGPERAQDLIDLRPYHSVDDLTRIKGIGPARIADIKSEGNACVR